GFVPMANTIVQASVPDEVRGRVMGVYAMCFAGMMPVGSFVAGSLAQAFGAPGALRIGIAVFSAYCVVQVLVAARRGWLREELPVPEVVPPRQPVTAGIPGPLDRLPRWRLWRYLRRR
ncbi:MAG: MFS transporter, partial [Armatimonadota bacterium]